MGGMQPPVLKTERLVLRPIRESDAAAQQKYISEWEVARYLSDKFPWPYPPDGGEGFVKKCLSPDVTSYYWAITQPGKHGDEMLGVIELRPNQERGQRGFWIGRPFQSQGIMTEAIGVTNDFWFYTLGKKTLWLTNAKDNRASSRLKEKTGARLHGIEPEKFLDPAFTEAEIWELTEEDWRAFKAAR